MVSTLRAWLLTRGPILLAAVVLLAAAYWMVDPTPPRRVVLATGPEDSGFAQLGARYRSVLRRHGIQVELRATDGARRNAELLLDTESGVDMAFVRGADFTAEERNDAELLSLGALFYEPIWLFHREGKPVASLAALARLKVNIGVAGTGTAHLVEDLLRQNGLSLGELDVTQFDNSTAVANLLHGDTDAVFVTSGSNGLLVQMLLRTPGVRLFDFAQAQAYSRRLPALAAVTLPRGVVDLSLDIPAADKQMLAPIATIAIREDTHPSLVDLMVQAAAEIHTQSDWFARPGQFPAADPVGFPVAREAQRFYRNGPPLLQRHLPFWAANLIERMWVVLLSIAALLIPLSRVIPPLYAWRMRSRIYRWYGELKAVERDAMAGAAAFAGIADAPAAPRAAGLLSGGPAVQASALAHGVIRGVARAVTAAAGPIGGPAAAGGASVSAGGGAGGPVADWLGRLDALEAQVNEIVVPLSYTDEVYFLRQHIDMVRRRIRQQARDGLLPPESGAGATVVAPVAG